MARNISGLLAFALMTCFVCEATAFAQGLGPLTATEKAAYETIPADPPPKSLTRNAHYVISDESDHWHYAPVLKDIGGAYIGVGTNQNYEMVGWARSSVVFMFDFDQVIVDLHSVYRVAFLQAKTPKDFIALWRDEAALVKLLQQGVTDPAAKTKALKALRLGRKLVAGKLGAIRRKHRAKKIASFLTHQEQYDFIVSLFRAGRVFAVRGDLTAARTLKAIGAALRRFSKVVGVLYVSNCEQYFADLPRSYRDNMVSLPFGPKSLVLRTRPWRERVKPPTASSQKSLFNGPLRYTYFYQDFPTMRLWFQRPGKLPLYRMLSRLRETDKAYPMLRKPR